MVVRVDRSAVELLIFMCVNKLLAGTGDPPGMIYPAGYGSGENSPPIMGTDILAVPNFYGGHGSEVTIPDGNLPIAILSLAPGGSIQARTAVQASRGRKLIGPAAVTMQSALLIEVDICMTRSI